MDEASIFLEALQKSSPEERAAYLDGECADNDALRRNVDMLLKAHAQAGDFLKQATPELASTMDQPIAERPGAVIGPYKLLQQIGEGGFGTVFLAEQTQPVQRKVALKVIKAGMDSRQIIARFEAERQALAMMDLVNIARVLDAGATESGRPYFVMELVHGVPITKYCDDNHLTPRERLELFVPVCLAIQHAHQKGIIHRDIKPSNVMITLYDGQPVPKVIDFGVAKATEQRLTERTLFTQYGTMVGTLEYMSPEQAEMSALGADTRSDIYSLGVLLYELLTGSTPLSHKRVREAAYGEVLRMIREEEPPKPSTRLNDSGEALASISAQRHMEPAKLTKLMRGELDWIVMKCLEKDRARRYDTASAFAVDVQRYLKHEAVEACPPSAIYKFRKFARRNRVVLGMAAIVATALLVVAAALGVSNLLLNEKQLEILREQREVVQANGLLSQKNEEILKERDAANKAAARAEAISKFFAVDLLGEAQPDRNAHTKNVTVEELLDRAAQKIDTSQELAQQPEVEADLRDAIGMAYFKLGKPKAALDHLQRAVGLRRLALGPDDPRTLAAQEHLADFMNLSLRRHDLAEPLSYQTWQARRRVLGPEDPDTLDSLDTHASALLGLNKFAEAEMRMRECWEARKRTLGETHDQTLISLSGLSRALASRGDLIPAEQMARDCLSERRKKDGLGKNETIVCLNNLSELLFLRGEFDEAKSLLKEGTEALLQTHGSQHQHTLHLQYMLSKVLLDEGKLDEAELDGRHALELRRIALQDGNENIGRSLLILGQILLAKSNAEEAEEMLRESAELFRENYKTKTDLISAASCWHGAALAALGKFAQAEPLLVDGYERYRKEPSVPQRHKDKIRKHIIKLYEDWGNPEKAARWRAKEEMK